MSTSDARTGVVPRESLTAYERWELPVVDAESPLDADGRPLTASQLEKLQQEAYEEGFASGHGAGFARGLEEGRAAGAAEMQPGLEMLSGALASLARPFEVLDEEVESALVALALAVARQLVGRELALRPELVVDAIREAVEALPTAQRRITLELNPEDLALVRESRALGPEAEHWQLRENAALARGGCRLETESSRIDATVERRLASVVAQVLGGVGDEDGGDGEDDGDAEQA